MPAVRVTRAIARFRSALVAPTAFSCCLMFGGLSGPPTSAASPRCKVARLPLLNSPNRLLLRHALTRGYRCRCCFSWERHRMIGSCSSANSRHHWVARARHASCPFLLDVTGLADPLHAFATLSIHIGLNCLTVTVSFHFNGGHH